jgi:hypothetical protein
VGSSRPGHAAQLGSAAVATTQSVIRVLCKIPRRSGVTVRLELRRVAFRFGLLSRGEFVGYVPER